MARIHRWSVMIYGSLQAEFILPTCQLRCKVPWQMFSLHMPLLPVNYLRLPGLLLSWWSFHTDYPCLPNTLTASNGACLQVTCISYDAICLRCQGDSPSRGWWWWVGWFFSLTSCAPNYSDIEGLQLLLGDDEDLQPDRPVQQQHEVGTRLAASNSRIWGQPQIRVSLIFETAKQILICRMKIEFITKIIIFILTNVNYHADGDNNYDCDHNIYNFIWI